MQFGFTERKLKMEDTVKKIIEQLPALESGKRLVVGIDGLSRSGKTTLTEELMRHFKQSGTPAASFHLDDFIVERERRYGTGHKEWHEYYHLQWETGWLCEHF